MEWKVIARLATGPTHPVGYITVRMVAVYMLCGCISQMNCLYIYPFRLPNLEEKKKKKKKKKLQPCEIYNQMSTRHLTYPKNRVRSGQVVSWRTPLPPRINDYWTCQKQSTPINCVHVDEYAELIKTVGLGETMPSVFHNDWTKYLRLSQSPSVLAVWSRSTEARWERKTSHLFIYYDLSATTALFYFAMVKVITFPTKQVSLKEGSVRTLRMNAPFQLI